ncbi:hypothetical protein HRbin35_00505 [bacterium HR35]|nr:hypothetical protein HRbin35_00505 [bacterium HR35]
MKNLLLILLLIYNAYLYLDLLLPPKIEIIFPPENYATSSEVIKLKGKIDKRADIYINDILIPQKEKGYFEKELYLKEGINRFIIRGVKFWGQENKKEIKVILLRSKEK